MNDNAKMLVTLTLFGLVAGLLLAATFKITQAPIAAARQQEELGALKRVLPECDNDVVADARTVTVNGVSWRFFVARRAGAFAGAAFRSSAPGYGGPIDVLVGVGSDGAIRGLEVLSAEKETPGLGAKVRDPDFRTRFCGKLAAQAAGLAVRKDGGDIDAITGATISSRAVCKAVGAGLVAFSTQADAIRAAAAPPANAAPRAKP